MVAETASIVAGGGKYHTNRLTKPIRLILHLGISFNGPYHGHIATYYHTKEAAMTNKCISIAGHFDGHRSVPEQYIQHRLMWHAQGYPGSHWMPPLGDYLLCLCIALVATRATANEIATEKWTNFAGHFDSRGSALVYRAHHLMEEVQGFTRSHWMPPLGKYYVQ
jgi:hypothetical protein